MLGGGRLHRPLGHPLGYTLGLPRHVEVVVVVRMVGSRRWWVVTKRGVGWVARGRAGGSNSPCPRLVQGRRVPTHGPKGHPAAHGRGRGGPRNGDEGSPRR